MYWRKNEVLKIVNTEYNLYMDREKQQDVLFLKKGNRLYRFVAFLIYTHIFFYSLLSSSAIARESVSVGVVNVTFLMENAPQSELASNRLKETFLPQEKKLAEELEEINNLEAELKKLITQKKINSDIKRQKERDLRARKRARSRLLQDFREELRFSRDTALDEVQKEVFSAIDVVRKAQNIDIILQDYISADERVDITPLVLEYLKKKLDKTPIADMENGTTPAKEKSKGKTNE